MNPDDEKAALLAEMYREWAKIESMCASLADLEMIAPGAQGEWSMKDILAHISAWEKYLLDRLSFVMTGYPPQYPVMTSWDDVHKFNAQVYIDNKDRSLNSVMVEFRNLYQGLVTVIQALPPALLDEPYNYDFPDDHITLRQLIWANTIEHYQEHTPPGSNIQPA